MATTSSTPQDDSQAVAMVVRLIVILLAVTGVPGAAWYWLIHESHWIHHEKLMNVYAENWTAGEYKDCVTLNVDLEEPYGGGRPRSVVSLTCDAEAKGKTFKVRFNADTYVKGQPDGAATHWRCRKYEVGDATIDCEFQSMQGRVEKDKDRVNVNDVPFHDSWTLEDEPPGRVKPENGSCPGGYKPVDHKKGDNGYVRHVDCIPASSH